MDFLVLLLYIFLKFYHRYLQFFASIVLQFCCLSQYFVFFVMHQILMSSVSRGMLASV